MFPLFRRSLGASDTLPQHPQLAQFLGSGCTFVFENTAEPSHVRNQVAGVGRCFARLVHGEGGSIPELTAHFIVSIFNPPAPAAYPLSLDASIGLWCCGRVAHGVQCSQVAGVQGVAPLVRPAHDWRAGS